jgi:hypothetical protein
MTTEKIYIGIDDQVIEAKGEVLETLLAEIEDNKAKEAAAQAAIAAKATAKAALLERLGITAEEANLLLS